MDDSFFRLSSSTFVLDGANQAGFFHRQVSSYSPKDNPIIVDAYEKRMKMAERFDDNFVMVGVAAPDMARWTPREWR